MVKSGAAIDAGQGKIILNKICELSSQCNPHMLANLKAQQQKRTGTPHDVLATVKPFVSQGDQHCWALNKAVWAHWTLGNVAEVRLLAVPPCIMRSQAYCPACSVNGTVFYAM